MGYSLRWLPLTANANVTYIYSSIITVVITVDGGGRLPVSAGKT